MQQHESSTSYGTANNRQKRRRLDHPVPRNQFILGQMFRQQTILHRPEQRGLHTKTRQHGQQRGNTLGHERHRGADHQQHLGHFADHDHARFRKSVGKLSRSRRQQNVRSNEQRTRQRRQPRAANAKLEDRQHHHRVLHQIVVQRAARLCQCKRPQATRLQQADRTRGGRHDRACPEHRQRYRVTANVRGNPGHEKNCERRFVSGARQHGNLAPAWPYHPTAYAVRRGSAPAHFTPLRVSDWIVHTEPARYFRSGHHST